MNLEPATADELIAELVRRRYSVTAFPPGCSVMISATPATPRPDPELMSFDEVWEQLVRRFPAGPVLVIPVSDVFGRFRSEGTREPELFIKRLTGPQQAGMLASAAAAILFRQVQINENAPPPDQERGL